MTPEQYQRLYELFDHLVDRDPDEQRPVLEGIDDPGLRAEVDALLAASRDAPGFLEEPATLTLMAPVSAAQPAPTAPAPGGRVCPRCQFLNPPIAAFCMNDGTKLPEPAASMIGQVIDQIWRIEAVLGSGGMGTVYRAVQRHIGLTRAIKLLPSGIARDPSARDRFVLEGRAAALLQHPNAAKVHDLRFLEDGTAYLVLDFVDGDTLRSLLAQGPLEIPDAMEIFGQIAEVVDVAHAAGVVHRDLKPENVMVSSSAGGWKATVLDFGIAKLLEPTAGEHQVQLTGQGSFVGTPAYMAPEQWGGPSRDGAPGVDGRVDVYALGLLFFEMVSGRLCFAGRSTQEYRENHLTQPPPALHELVPSLPLEASEVVAKALAKERADRYATAGELLAQLRTALLPKPAAEEPSVWLATDRVTLLDTLRVATPTGDRRIELYYGDLMKLPPDVLVDILVVSAFPGKYAPTPGTLVEALEGRGFSLARLAHDREVDLRATAACWLSRKLRPSRRGWPPAERILCFEPDYWDDPAERIGDLFRAMATVVNDRDTPATVAMPLVACGHRRGSPSEMVTPLLEAAAREMRSGMNVGRLMIVDRSRTNAKALIRAFEEFKRRATPSASR